MCQGAVSYYGYRLAGAVVPRVPPRLGYLMAEQFGSVLCRLSPLRGNVEDNLSHVVGEQAASPRVRCLARQVFRNQCKNYFDLFRVPCLSAQDVMRAVPEVRGLEHLDRALSRGRGVVLASAHFGNFDLAAQILALRGYQVVGLAEHLQPERLFQYVCRTRQSHGLRYIPIDGPLRAAFRSLRANHIVGLAMDRNVTDAGRAVELFGQPARLPVGYVKLVLHTGAALVLAFCRRLPDNRCAITIEPEVEILRSGDLERDVAANMASAVAILETHLRRHPEQWVFFQRAWEPAATARHRAVAVDSGELTPGSAVRSRSAAPE